jgi:hypothetical protein
MHHPAVQRHVLATATTTITTRTIVALEPRFACCQRIRSGRNHHWNNRRHQPLAFAPRFGSHTNAAAWHRHTAFSTRPVWPAFAILSQRPTSPLYGQWCLDGRQLAEFRSRGSFSSNKATTRRLTTTVSSGDKDNHGAQSETTTLSRIHLKACWNDDDLLEGDVVHTTFSLQDIQQEAQDLFGSNEQLEYYNGDDWCRLDEQSLREIPAVLNELKESSTSAGYGSGKLPPLPIRVPSLYDEEYGMENDLVKLRKLTPEQMQAQQQGMPTEDQALMYDVLHTLHSRLLQQGYTRHCQPKRAIDVLALDSSDHVGDDYDDYEYTVAVDNVALPTRTWILEQAEDDASVRSVLLSQPRALRHITEALHYPLY